MTSAQISFADPEVQKCPFGAYAKVRAQEPVYLDPKTGFYVVTDYALLRKCAEDAATFSNHSGLILVKEYSPIKAQLDEIWKDEGVMPVSVLAVADAPDHTFHRSFVDKAFTPVRVRQLEGFIEGMVNSIIDEFIDRGEVEFLSEMAMKMTMSVFADMLGVPRSNWEQFKMWADTTVAQGRQDNSEEEQIRITHVLAECQRYMLARAEEYRAAPKECILSDLANVDVDGRRITDEELAAICIQLLVGGYETTSATLAAGMLRVIRMPGLEDKLRAEPALIPGFFEEVLRQDAPIQSLFRRATRDTELGGVKLPAGSIIQLAFGGANRDPAMFENPDSFDPARQNARRHLSFSFGPHVCVGNQLARGELRIAFNLLLQRMKNFRLQKEPEYFAHPFAYGVTALNIAFDRV
ncbi:MAG: cytochrome P450 [Betaproteobacteria bacterium HGW-Betaproteobacteria-4]|jgi:cytochrome P450|nr:MAG: cytochrome P450 [Betaproteobacteria bacterium HGW-Betaproteobacteria-4]